MAAAIAASNRYRLSDAEYRVLLALALDSFDGRTCQPSYRELCYGAAMFKGRLVDALSSLEKPGKRDRPALIRRHRSGRRTMYELLFASDKWSGRPTTSETDKWSGDWSGHPTTALPSVVEDWSGVTAEPDGSAVEKDQRAFHDWRDADRQLFRSIIGSEKITLLDGGRWKPGTFTVRALYQGLRRPPRNVDWPGRWLESIDDRGGLEEWLTSEGIEPCP